VAAARVLDGALAADARDDAVLRYRALVLRADLAVRLDDAPLAESLLTEAAATEVGDAADLADERRRTAELRADLEAGRGDGQGR
jgi:metal-dependent HD superfamily phosphatase/phosphodiesterase